MRYCATKYDGLTEEAKACEVRTNSVTYVPCYILYILNWTYLILLSYYLVYFICIIELLFHLILFETIYCTISLYDLYELIFCANANVIFHSDIYYMYALLSYMLWARQPLLYYYVLLIVDRCHICRTFPNRPCHPPSRTSNSSHCLPVAIVIPSLPSVRRKHPYLNCTCLLACSPIDVYIRLYDYSIICRWVIDDLYMS